MILFLSREDRATLKQAARDLDGIRRELRMLNISADRIVAAVECQPAARVPAQVLWHNAAPMEE
jgi:hypothetical protein